MTDYRRNLNKIILAAEHLIDGRSVAWVAREYALTPKQVSNLGSLLGIPGRERSSPKSVMLEVYDKVEHAVLDGWPIHEIARTYGIDRGTVRRWFPEYVGARVRDGAKLRNLYNAPPGELTLQKKSVD